MTAQAMVDTYPAEINLDRKQLAKVINAVTACAQTCTACADACLSEYMVAELTKCIRTNLDCADICTATGRLLPRHTRLRRQHHPRRPGGLRHRLQRLRRRM